MKKLECTIFDVDHGFCAFVKSPNSYGLLIDAGSKQNFSPIKWIRNEYCNSLNLFERKRIAKCIITHLHADHFSDVGSFEGYEDPKILLRDKQTMKFVDKKIDNAKEGDEKVKILKKFKKFSNQYTEDVDDGPDWGFENITTKQITYQSADDASESDEKIINNRSFITSIVYAGVKILFPGDTEVEGWEKAFESNWFSDLVKDTNFFITSHHGHKSGFTKKMLDYSGIPDLYIVSAKSGDDSIDSSYSKEENSIGYMIYGENNLAYMASTRSKHMSIKITIYEDGDTEVSYLATPDNLNVNQSKIRARRTKQMTANWR